MAFEWRQCFIGYVSFEVLTKHVYAGVSSIFTIENINFFSKFEKIFDLEKFEKFGNREPVREVVIF